METLKNLSEPSACPWEGVSQWASDKDCSVSWEACDGGGGVSAPLARLPHSSPLAPPCFKELRVVTLAQRCRGLGQLGVSSAGRDLRDPDGPSGRQPWQPPRLVA